MPWAAPTDSQLRQTRQTSQQRYNAERTARRGPDPRSTARWRRVRSQKLAQQPLCEVCLAQGKTVVAEQVDHTIEMLMRPDLCFDMHNLSSLCVPCHAAKSSAERRA